MNGNSKELFKIWALPEYDLSRDFFKDYVKEVKAISTTDELFHHMMRWRELISIDSFPSKDEMGGILENLISIRSGALSPDEDNDNNVALEIVLPRIALLTLPVAKAFCVSEYSAMHRLFCKQPNHSLCFGRNGALEFKITKKTLISRATERAIAHGGTIHTSMIALSCFISSDFKEYYKYNRFDFSGESFELALQKAAEFKVINE